MKNRKKIFDLVIFSILCALAYVGTMIMIPLPTGAFIHLGNLVCIMAALILGGVKGGLVGSIGMTLFDLFNGYHMPEYSCRTLVLKFLMGLTCGIIYKYLATKETSKKINLSILFGLAGIFLAGFAFSLYAYLTGGLVNSAGKVYPVHVLIPISTCLFGSLFLVAGIFVRTKQPIYQQVLIGASIATLVNIIGEVIAKIIVNLIHGFDFVPSFIDSIVKTPASLFTGILTIVCACTLFPLLKKSLLNRMNSLEEKDV